MVQYKKDLVAEQDTSGSDKLLRFVLVYKI